MRVLSRKGILIFNAVGSERQLGDFKANIPGQLSAVSFAKGQQYTDFNSGFDEVAGYGIGGSIRGKVLAEASLFAVMLEFWKLGLLALSGAWVGFKRFFTGKKLAPTDDPAPDDEPTRETPEA